MAEKRDGDGEDLTGFCDQNSHGVNELDQESVRLIQELFHFNQ